MLNKNTKRNFLDLQYCKEDVEIYYADGNHLTIMSNPKVSTIINNIMGLHESVNRKLPELTVPPNTYHVKNIN